MRTAYICICSDEYLKHYNVLYNSLKIHAPNDGQILFYIGDKPTLNYDQYITINNWYDQCDPSYNRLERICSLRARAVLETFQEGYDVVVFTGAKVEFFDNPWCLTDPLTNLATNWWKAVVTPHILEPLPEDGNFPSNATVNFTGHISTDVVAFKKDPEIIKFLEWQDEIMKTKCKTTAHTYLDQSWLNFLPFFAEYVKILRHPGYNVAYWNWYQRKLKKENGVWKINGDDCHWIQRNMVCFQYSGLDLNNIEGISRHQNRYKADGEFLEFLKEYAEKVK